MSNKRLGKVISDLDFGKPMLVALLCSALIVTVAAACNDFNPGSSKAAENLSGNAR